MHLPLNQYSFYRNFKITMLLIAYLTVVTNAKAPQQIHLTYKNFTIYCSPEDQKTGEIVGDLLQNHIPRFEKFYEIKINDPVRIIIAASRIAFRSAGNFNLPQWAGAAYIPHKNLVVVKSPSWAGSTLNLEKDILHELSHLYFDSKFQSIKIPLWYNEGLAEYMSGQHISMFNATKIANAIMTKEIPPLEEIDSLNSFSQAKANLAYLLSLSTIDFMNTHFFGTEDWHHFHNLILQNGWHWALEQKFGMNQLEFEVFWYRYIEDKYRWLVILNFENLLWFSLIIFLFFALYLVRWRNKKKIKKWAQEEETLNSSIKL